MDRQWSIRYGRHNLRLHADISTSAELSSTRVSAILCSNYLDDSCVCCRIMVFNPIATPPDSRLGYRFYRASTYYEFGRDAYEAFVVCSFMILMCNFLGSELVCKVKSKGRQTLIFPLCCIGINVSSWVYLFVTELTRSISLKQSNGNVFAFPKLMIGVFYNSLLSIVRSPHWHYSCIAAVSITAIILQTQNLLCPESMSLAFGNSWLQIVKVISVTVATYFLIEFYFIIRKDIAYIFSGSLIADL